MTKYYKVTFATYGAIPISRQFKELEQAAKWKEWMECTKGGHGLDYNGTEIVQHFSKEEDQEFKNLCMFHQEHIKELDARRSYLEEEIAREDSKTRIRELESKIDSLFKDYDEDW